MKRTLLIPLFSMLTLTPAIARADTGQRLEITTAAKMQSPDAKAIVHALLGDEAAAKTPRRVTVKLIDRQPQDRFSTLEIELHGALFPNDSAERLRAMFPSLRAAQIAIVGADESALPPLPPDPNELSTPEQIEAFKEKVQAQLKADGKSGTVEVSVETSADGQRQVKVEVKAESAK